MEVDNESSNSSSPAPENQEVNPRPNEAESTGVEPMEQGEEEEEFEGPQYLPDDEQPPAIVPSSTGVIGDGQPEPGTVPEDMYPSSSDEEEDLQRKDQWERAGVKNSLRKYRIDDKKALEVLNKHITRMGTMYMWGKTPRGIERQWHDYWPQPDRECRSELCPCRNVELSSKKCKCRKCERLRIDPISRDW